MLFVCKQKKEKGVCEPGNGICVIFLLLWNSLFSVLSLKRSGPKGPKILFTSSSF
jgi:hypothetical protein